MLARKLEIWWKGTVLELAWRGIRLVEIGFTSDGKPAICIPNPDDVQLLDLMPASLESYDCDVLIKEEVPDWDVMKLPKFRRETIEATNELRGPRAEAKARYEIRSEESIDGLESKKILNSILDSLIEEPQQSKKRQAKITCEISEKLGLPKMSVAGVRANFTRGTYGSPEELIAARRRTRAAAARVAQA